jgi:hypothetical protein
LNRTSLPRIYPKITMANHDDEVDMDDMEGGMPEMDDMDDDDLPLPNLHWSMTLTTNGDNEIDAPEVPGWVIHITHACFGVDVKKDSRTVIVCENDTDDDPSNKSKPKESPLCVLLEGKQENVNLDLLITEPLKFALKGKNASTVTLSGYIQPPPNMGPDTMMSPHDMDNDDDEEMMNMHDEEAEKEHIRDIMRKRKLEQSIPEETKEDKKDQVKEPPTKKAKTDGGNKNKDQSQAQQQQKKNDNKKSNQPQQQPASKTAQTTNQNQGQTTQPTNQDDSKKSKTQKKKRKKTKKKCKY